MNIFGAADWWKIINFWEWQWGWGGEQCKRGRWGGQRGKRVRGRAVGMRRERAWIKLLNLNEWAQIVQVACKHIVGTRTWNEQLECSQFLSCFDNSCLVGVPTCQAHVCMQRAATAHPVVNIFCKSNFYVCKWSNVRSGASSGVVWPCGFVWIG